MAHIIDIRSSENELLILGGALTLPTSSNTVTSPLDGSIRWNSSTNVVEYYYSGLGWTAFVSSSSAPYDVYGTFIGQPLASQTLWRIVFARTVTFPQNLTGAAAVCEVSSSTNIHLPILQNGSSIGTINFASSSITGTFTFPSQTTFNLNDVLEIDGPSAADATFLSPSWAFLGTRT